MTQYDIYIRVAGSVGDAPIQRIGVEAANARAALESVATVVCE